MRVFIVGGTSAIAGETAKAYAEAGARLFLTGRNPDRLASVADDLRVRRHFLQALDRVSGQAHQRPLFLVTAGGGGCRRSQSEVS